MYHYLFSYDACFDILYFILYIVVFSLIELRFGCCFIYAMFMRLRITSSLYYQNYFECTCL